MFIVLILVVATPYFIRLPNIGRPWTFLGWNLSTWHQNLGWLLAGIMVVHLLLNIRWICKTLKNFFKLNRAAKAQIIIMLLLIIAMGASIISGAIWGSQPGPAPPAGEGASQYIRVTHILTSWAAVLLAGMHIGEHFNRFMGFFNTEQSAKKDATKEKAD